MELRPIAFRPSLLFNFATHTNMGRANRLVVGWMKPYIWRGFDDQLVVKRGRRFETIWASSLTEEDFANLEVGVQGDLELLDEVYDAAIHQLKLEAEGV